jgi:hypothetical protein
MPGFAVRQEFKMIQDFKFNLKKGSRSWKSSCKTPGNQISVGIQDKSSWSGVFQLGIQYWCSELNTCIGIPNVHSEECPVLAVNIEPILKNIEHILKT